MTELERAQNLWEQTLNHYIKAEISTLIYNTWFKAIQPFFRNENELVLSVSDEIARNYVDKYVDMISEALLLESGRRYDVKVEIQALRRFQNESAKTRPASVRNTLQQAAAHPAFNPNYTFDQFIVGESNRFAYAACVAVASMGDTSYNPLFLYGGSGLGKTHLLQAIGNEVLKQHPDKKIIYVQSERFVNEFIDCIAKKNFDEFRNHYRQADLLLIDDIQFLEGKERMQEEFFHTFNALYEFGKQIVLTCDKPPQSLATLEERLKTRMGSGIICDITPPDYETRMAILNQLMARKQIQLDHDVLDFVARNITSNIRELEGAFKTIDAYSRLGHLMDLESVQNALKDMIHPDRDTVIDIDLIQEIVSNYYNLSRTDLRSNKRGQNIVVPRQLAMYLCRQLTDMTYEEIGQHFGKHHATAMHACTRIEQDLDHDRQLKSDYDTVLKRIQA